VLDLLSMTLLLAALSFITSLLSTLDLLTTTLLLATHPGPDP
jgi:hypothetical protein